MAMAVINVVGALAGVVGVGMMIPGLLPEKDEHETVVRIAAGLSKDEADTTAGNTPGITLYDIMGRRIGQTKGKKNTILDGDFIDIKVPFDDDVGKKPTEYISVVDGGDDALCVAYVALTQPDGTKKAWYGDVAKACGADWYHSQLKTGEDDYQPACIWIDRNRSNKLRFQGFGIHITDFAATDARAKQYEENRDLMCKVAPRFKMYENLDSEDTIPYFSPPLEMVPKDLTDKDTAVVFDKSHWVISGDTDHMNKGVVDAVKRDNMPANPGWSGNQGNTQQGNAQQAPNQQAPNQQAPNQQAPNQQAPNQQAPNQQAPNQQAPNQQAPNQQGNNQVNTAKPRVFNDIIISDSRWHSAKDLCHSDTSLGHDFVSVKEGLFCDMHSSPRRLWPVCGGSKQSGCFDLDTSQMRPGNGLRGRDVDTGTYPPKKDYNKTVRWN